MDDVITVALAIAPDLVETTDRLFADVVLEKGVARGQTVAYRGRQILPGGGLKMTRIATGLDGRRFLSIFKSTMARYERNASPATAV
jgi:purine nucleosidase